MKTLAAMPAHNEDERIAKVVLGAKTNPDMGAGSEILTQVKDCNLNLRVVEIPITVRYDISGTSSKNPVSHGFGVLV
jgi:hypothetical protein